MTDRNGARSRLLATQAGDVELRIPKGAGTETIGRVLEALDRMGAADETIVVVCGDHGEEFAEHGGFWHGTTLYDEQVHTPFIVKLAGQAMSGTRLIVLP